MSRRLLDALALQEVGARIAGARHKALCLDFDGTLTPIVDNPAEVALSRSVAKSLEAIAARKDFTVAIISGRNRSDLQARIGIQGLIYAGNHGLEISGDGLLFVERVAAERYESLESLGKELSGRLEGIPGAHVEDKGLTLSVHFRQVAESGLEDVRRIVHAALAGSSHPFVLTTGDKVYEIRPRVYWNKGTAARWIMEKLGQQDALPVYVGDDVTDEDAFTALADGITVHVGQSSQTAAQYRLENPTEVEEFLRWLTSFPR